MQPVNMLRVEYARAENALYWSLLLLAVVNALTIAQLYVPAALTWALVSVGVALQLAAFTFRLISDRHARLGQRFRHVALLVNVGLPSGPPASAALLVADTNPSPLSHDPSSEYAYYTSNESTPERRLVDNVAESAFFGVHIAERAAKYLFIGALCFFLVVLYALVTAVFITDATSHTRLAAQVVLLVLAFVGAGDFVALAYRYADTQIPGRALVAECDRLLAGSVVSLAGSYSVLAEYEVLMANCPPLPRSLYRRHRERLTDAWQHRKESLNGATSADASGRN